MRRLWILLLGWTALVCQCGGRTPFGDPEPDNGAAGASTSGGIGGTGSSASSTVVGTGAVTGVSGVGSVTSGGAATTGGTGGVSTSSGITVGSSSSVTTTTTSSTGVGGGGGRGGTAGRDAGPPNRRDAGSNALLGILPGIRPGPACVICVDDRCAATSACSSDRACIDGVSCYLDACAMIPDPNTQLACATKCFRGDTTLLANALQAVTCVYGPCGGPCGARGPGGPM